MGAVDYRAVVFFIWILICASPQRGGASTTSDHRGDGSQVFFEAGAYLPNSAYVAEDRSGNTSLFYPIYGLVGPRGSLPLLTPRLRFEPGVRFVLPWRSNIDGDTTYYTTLFTADLSLFVSQAWEVRAGVGFQWLYINGSERVVVHRNGTSTSQFYVPAVSRSVWLASIDIGGSYRLTRSLRMSFDTMWWNIASSERRKMSLVLGLGYAIF
jgi:hypothetical protein